MLSPFHISKVQSNGSRHWIEGAVSVESARARVKALAAFSPCDYVITNLTGREIPAKSLPKRRMFQIGYDERELNARAEMFRRVGREVISVPDNETAKRVLASLWEIIVTPSR